MIKFDFCSDLHVDIWQKYQPNPDFSISDSEFKYIDWSAYKNADSDILIIAGDIADNEHISLKVIQDASQVYKIVIVVDGNHDHYAGRYLIGTALKMFRTECAKFGNVIFLDGEETFQIENTLFCGAMGWYDWKCYEQRGIPWHTARRVWQLKSRDSDYPQFEKGLDPAGLAEVNVQQLTKVVEGVTDNDDIQSIVMITHTAPRAEVLLWKGDPEWDILTPSYVNSQMSRVLAADTGKKIKYWIYGHSHTRNMVDIDGVTYLNNARGLPFVAVGTPWFLPQMEVNTE